MTKTDIARVQAYLRKTFGNSLLTIKARSTKDDSAEVLLGDEFIGIVFRDDEDGDVSYCFEMAILEMDLPRVASVARG